MRRRDVPRWWEVAHTADKRAKKVRAHATQIGETTLSTVQVEKHAKKGGPVRLVEFRGFGVLFSKSSSDGRYDTCDMYTQCQRFHRDGGKVKVPPAVSKLLDSSRWKSVIIQIRH